MEFVETASPWARDLLPSLSDILADHPGWLDEAVASDEAEAITGTPAATLATMRTRGGGPKFFKRGSRVFYRRRALFAWLDQHREVASTSEL